MHAELKIGNSKIMLNDAMMGAKGPHALGGSPASLWLYVEDSDALFNRAVAAGAKTQQGPMGDAQGRPHEAGSRSADGRVHEEPAAACASLSVAERRRHHGGHRDVLKNSWCPLCSLRPPRLMCDPVENRQRALLVLSMRAMRRTMSLGLVSLASVC
jgi:hypothetical protein